MPIKEPRSMVCYDDKLKSIPAIHLQYKLFDIK